MLRMVALEGGELARRRVSLSELQYPDQAKNKRVEKALKKFVEARLIVRNQDPTDETYVEPAHDALILGWERLLRWKNQNQENIVLQQSVRRAAQDWNERNGSLWNADPNLNKLSEIKQSNNNWLNQLETDFVQKSLNKRRRNRFTITAVGGFICLALGAVTVFLAQSKRREVENITAASGARLRTHDQLGAVLDAVRAGDKFEQMKGGLSGLYHRWFRRTIWAETQFEVTTTLHQALANTHEQNRLEGQEGEGHSDGVNDVAFSPECPNSERLIASASDDKNVKVWSLTGALFNEEDIKHEDYVSSVSFSPDCQILASGSYDGTVKLWKPDGTKIRTIRDNADRVTDIDFSRDGKIIAVAIDDPDGVGQVELWSPHGDLIDSFKGKTNEFSRVSFNSDGTKIALAGRKVKVWNRDGDDRDPQTFDAQADSVWGISFSPDGKMIASSSGDGTITLWNLDGERLGSKEEAHSGSINDLSFTPNGQAIASVGEDSLIKFWDLSNQEDVHGQIKLKPSQLYEKIYQGHEGAVNSISFSSDGELFATASKDDSVKLWSLSEELVNSVVQVHSSDDRIWRSYFSPNNQSLVLIRNDNGVELWHLNSGKQIQLREPNENEFLEVSFSQDGETIALLPGNSSEVTFWNSTGEPIGSLQDQALADRDGSIRGIQLSPDGKILATANSDYTIKLWNRETGSSIPIKAHDGDITNLKFSSDGAILASASEDNRVKLWNLEGELLKSLNGYSTPLRTLRFSPDDKFLAFLASKDRGNVIKLWNIEEQKLTSLPGHTEPVTSIRFSPDGGIIVSASRDDTIRLWSSSGQTLETLIGPEGWVDDVIFHPNSRILASFSALSNDNPIKLWSIDGREITTLNAASVQSIHFSQGGDKLIAVYDSGSFVSRNLNRLQLLELSCQRLEDYLQTHRNIETEDDLCQDYLVE
jgi:WD40 repeat protein